MSETITLYCKNHKSDKVYQVSLEPKDGGFVVNAANGPRGGTMVGRIKTNSPLPYDKAKKVYDDLVREKLAKGYTQGVDSTPFQHTDKEKRVTGVLPQLLNVIEEAELEALFKDDRFWMQEKHDGRRILLRRESGQENATGINKTGLVIGIPQSYTERFNTINHYDIVIDGESIGDKYYAFDLLSLDGVNYKTKPYSERLSALIKILENSSDGVDSTITYVKTAKTSTQKRNMFESIKNRNGEGCVFKEHAAPYTVGRPSSGGTQLKFKFYATASFVVNKINDTKRSVNLKLLENDKWIDIGNCTISPNFEIPKADDIVEVRYLYANKGGSIYQPVYLGVRDDVYAKECITSQLKYKPKDAEEDE